MKTLKEINQEIRLHKRAMKDAGVRIISCFNAGLTPEERRWNTGLFKLNTERHLIANPGKVGQ